MPVTISYDLRTDDANQRSYVRSMFERFGWERLGESVFRYPHRDQKDEPDDWLNDIVPSSMFFRSYVKKNFIQLRALTIDSHGCSFFEQDDAQYMLDLGLQEAGVMASANPTNNQSSVTAIRTFIDAVTNAAP